MPTIDVNLPADAYRIDIEPGAIARLGAVVRDVAPDGRVLLAVDESLSGTAGPAARASLEQAGYDVAEVTLRAAESAKTLATVDTIYDAMLTARLQRRSPVVALGGGVVGDVAGFAAATYLRGVPLVQVPTTLLAMVDASIGGKTGVNHRLPGGGDGKNLVGAFWQPRAVLVDPRVLATLDDRHLRCGLAESIKHGMIADATLVEEIASSIDAIMGRDDDVLSRLIDRSARIKVGIVERDVRESGERALLNLGHTFAHAIEPVAELGLHHGEAVAIGLCAATVASVELGRCDTGTAARVRAAVEAVGLPTCLAAPVGVRSLSDTMRYDKKAVGDGIRLVLPVGPGVAEVVDDVPIDVVETAWVSVGAARG